MSSRKARIFRANLIFDEFPMADYPPQCHEKLKADLIVVRVKLASAIEEVLKEETVELTGHVQMLLAELRISIDNLDGLI